MTRKIIATDSAPKAIGPYSQAVSLDGWIFCSGQIGLEPAGGNLVAGGVSDQTRRALKNLEAVLEAAGSALNRVVKTTVYLKDMNDFAAMNAVYAEFFANDSPARATIQAARLPKDALVEIDAIAKA
jgi:2-iminobutanoate/2-iminopropanoate deaminase